MKTKLQDGLRSFEKKQIVVSALGLLIIVGLSVVSTFLYRSAEAEASARLISRMIHTQDRREIVSTLQDARLNQFKTIRYVSDAPGASFTLPELADLMPDKSPWHSLVYQTIRVSAGDENLENVVVYFEFSRYAQVPWGILVWLILNLISIPQTRVMKRRIAEQYEKDLEIDKKVARAEIANIVRHNIRTPLSALLRLSSAVTFSRPDEAEVFQSVIAQIRQLIAKLDVVPRPDQRATSGGFFDSLQAAIHELRLDLPSSVRFESVIDDSLPSVTTRFIESELQSMIENLVNNAVEAMSDNGGFIYLEARDLGHSVSVRVEDNGRGIPQKILDRVTEKGFSFGKTSGTGLGLFHAAECVREWGGHLNIDSKPGQGTVVEFQLPIQGRQSWYVPRVKLDQDSVVVVLDDQISVHRIWKMKLDEVGFSGRAFYFETPDELIEKIKGFPAKELFFFVDYDFLDPNRNGVDLLKELPSESNRYLVTGHFDDAKIRFECSRDRLSLIPKTELPKLPLVLVSPAS